MDPLKTVLQKKRPSLVNRKGVILQHDNTRPHTARVTKNLLEELHSLLASYYNNAYYYNFALLAKIYIKPNHILVLPNVTIYGRVNIGNEIFGSTFSKRHKTLAKILTKFILDDNFTNIFPGLI